MTIRRTLPILALVAAVAVTGTAFARGPHGPGGGPGGPGMGPDLGRFAHHLSVVLDLSDAQQSQIDGILDAARTAIEPIATQLADTRDAWRDANPLGSFDEAAFRRHFAAQSDLHEDLAVIVHRAMNDVWNVLTPEQQTQAEGMMDRLHQRRGEGPGGKRGGFFGHGRHQGDCPYGTTD